MSADVDYSQIHIESTLPKPWEQEQTFNDVLYDWMSRAPWLAISAAAHLLVFFILMAIPWDQFRNRDDKKIQASLQQAPEELFEEPEPEEIEEEIEEEPIEEPILKDAEISDHNEEDVDQDFEQTEGDPDFLSDSPFDSDAFNDVIGIGGGAGGKFGGRFGGRRNLRAAGGSGTEQALKDGLEWLKNHQSEDGSWDSDGFMGECGKIGSTVCDGPGGPTHDVGLTGLALLAFLGDGNTTSQGPYKEVVARGVKWLREQQDPDTGLLGEKSAHDFIYDHALGALALSEAYYFSKSPLLKSTAQKAVNYITLARNPYGAWRYDVPPIGDNDTSVTGWMIFVLASARDAKLEVDPAAFDGALSWIEEVTDPATGRVGYDAFGSLSSRTPANEHYPREKGEAMTSVGLLCRIFLGQDPDQVDILKKHADLLKRTPPLWDPEGFGCDMYYWYYGTYAMFQMGGSWWKAWNEAMKTAILPPQRKEGDEKGSWDPVGPWGYAGGRVYSTALMTLCLEVYFRYSKVLGAR
jgi:hypothetical protein